MNAKPLDACPEGRQRPGPGSAGTAPKSANHCADPPNRSRPQGQECALQLLSAETVVAASAAPSAACSAGRRHRREASATTSSATHNDWHAILALAESPFECSRVTLR